MLASLFTITYSFCFFERHSCPGIQLRQRKRFIAFKPALRNPKATSRVRTDDSEDG